MCVKVDNFEGTRQAAEMFTKTAKEAGCHWVKVHRAEKDPSEVLWLMEWESHDAFDKSGDESGEKFNQLVNPAGDWKDVVWHLSDAASIEWCSPLVDFYDNYLVY
jgi:quinol monooxygenase YgiN